LAHGGTGATDAAGARTNLDVFSKGEIQGGVNLTGGPVLVNAAYLRSRIVAGTLKNLIGLGTDGHLKLADAAVEIHLTQIARALGGIALPNAVAMYGKTVAGLDRPLLYMNASDVVVVGDGSKPVTVDGPTLTVNGVAAHGDAVFDNEVAMQGKTVAGVALDMIRMGNDDRVYLGNGTSQVVADATLIATQLLLTNPLAMVYGGVPAGGAAGTVLTKVSATDRDLAWIAPTAGTPADNSITNAKLRDSAALSVIGRTSNSIGDPADMAASADGQILRRSGTALGFGQIDLSSVNAIGVNPLPISKGGTGQTALGTADQLLATTGGGAAVGVWQDRWAPKRTPVDHSVAGWSWVNQGGSSLVQSAGAAFYLFQPNTTESVRLRVHSFGQAQYTTACFIPGPLFATDYNAVGICLRDGANKFVAFHLIAGATVLGFQVRRNNSPTSNASTTAASANLRALGGPVWLRMEFDTTSPGFYRFFFSFDGLNWTLYMDWERVDTFVLSASQVGVIGFGTLTTGIYPGCSVISWSEA
jgi:hypothetical protein